MGQRKRCMEKRKERCRWGPPGMQCMSKLLEAVVVEQGLAGE